MRTYLLIAVAIALAILLVVLAARPAGQHTQPAPVTPLTAAPAVTWTGGN